MKRTVSNILLTVLGIACVSALLYLTFGYILKEGRNAIEEITNKNEICQQSQEEIQNLEKTISDEEIHVDKELEPYKESLEKVNCGVVYAIKQTRLDKNRQEILAQYQQSLKETDRNILLSIKEAKLQEDKDNLLEKYKEVVKDTNRSFLTELEKSETVSEMQNILENYKQLLEQINKELP